MLPPNPKTCSSLQNYDLLPPYIHLFHRIFSHTRIEIRYIYIFHIFKLYIFPYIIIEFR